MEPAKVLIIRFSSIGDIVLTTPVIRQLKANLVEGSEIHFLTKPQYAHLLEVNPHVDKVHCLEDDIKVTCEKLKLEHFNYVIDLHKNLRSAIVKRQLNQISFTLEKSNKQKWKLVNFPWYTKPVDHIVKRYMDVASPFGCMEDDRGLDYFIPEGIVLPEGLPSKPFIAWVLGGAHQGKQLSIEKNGALLSKLKYPVVLLGGKAELEMSQTLSDMNHVHNLVGEINLDQSALVLQKSHLVVTGDTGLMHMASALDKTIISLWGCTSPAFGMDPYRPGKNSLVIEPLSQKKRPCSKLGDRCKYGWSNKCTSHLDESQITEAISDRMLS